MSHDVPPEPAIPDETNEDLISPDWPAWAAAYLNALSKTLEYSSAADAVGLSRKTPQRWRQRDEAFALACDEAQAKALDLIVRTNYAVGTSGMPLRKTVTKTRKTADGETIVEVTETEELIRDLRAGQFLLMRHRPEYRSSFRIEQSGPDGGPIKHELSVREDEAVRDFYAALDELVPPAP